MIYFAQLPTGGIKIGHSADVPARLAQLEAHYGAPLALLRVVPGGRPEEAAWHDRFAHARLGRTEQFRPVPELMAAIGRPLLVSGNPDTIEAVAPATVYLKLDVDVVRDAKLAASLMRMSLADYASDVLAKAAERDIGREARKLAKRAGGDE